MEDILKNLFEQLYKPESWLKGKRLPAVRTNKFLISSEHIGQFERISRDALRTNHPSQRYVIKDIMVSKENKIYYYIFTSEYQTVEDAHNGFFHDLWGAEVLQSRADGIVKVGDISFGNEQCICFVRNNTTIRIIASTANTERETLEQLARNIDRQIVEKSI